MKRLGRDVPKQKTLVCQELEDSDFNNDLLNSVVIGRNENIDINMEKLCECKVTLKYCESECLKCLFCPHAKKATAMLFDYKRKLKKQKEEQEIKERYKHGGVGY